jgi:hypothetical protein
MRKTLIALATAGVVASSVAMAGNTTGHAYGSATFVPVQYTQQYPQPNPQQYGDRWHDDRWDDRSQTVNEREARIRARIERGQFTGRLTDFEARRLYRQLNVIEAKERSFMADGRLNRRESAELNQNLDVLANNVRTQMRDEDRRYSYNRQ